jgi:hypothetical protein
MPDRGKRGMILFIVIGVVMVVVVLATVVLTIIANQSRLTHHMVSRVQAHYAAKAGIVYALEKLRLGRSNGGWAYISAVDNDCPNATPCSIPGDLGYATPVLAGFPPSIKSIKVIFCPAGIKCDKASNNCIPPRGYGHNFCINSTVDFEPIPDL